MFKASKQNRVKALIIIAASVGMKFVTGFALATLFGLSALQGLAITLSFWAVVILLVTALKRSKRKWIEHGRTEGLAHLVCPECFEQAYLCRNGSGPHQSQATG